MSKIGRIGPSALYLLHIELKHTNPVIWRKVLVPDTISLVKLHRVIQEAMGWWDYHLHEFVIGDSHYGVVDPTDPGWDMGPPMINEQRKKLNAVLRGARKFEYVYDYGDNWWHKITVENQLPMTSPVHQVHCLAGEMACPPEDVGGIPGYYEFIEVMNTPGHEEHESMLEWYGRLYDPAELNLSRINENLAQIKL